jgi:hypothetical protein
MIHADRQMDGRTWRNKWSPFEILRTRLKKRQLSRESADNEIAQ